MLSESDILAEEVAESNLEPVVTALRANQRYETQDAPKALLPPLPIIPGKDRKRTKPAGDSTDDEDSNKNKGGKKRRKAMVSREYHPKIKARCARLKTKMEYIPAATVAKNAGGTGCKFLMPEGRTDLCMLAVLNGECPKFCKYKHDRLTDNEADDVLAKAEPGLVKMEMEHQVN